MEQKKWGIIGGGIMGMTLAHRLAQAGQQVTIYEAAPNLGGLVSPWKMGDVEWDKFYHVILMSDTWTRQMLKEIGLDEKIEWVETKTGFYVSGKLYSVSNTFEFLKFPVLNFIDKFRLGLTIFIASKIKNWRRLEKITVVKWLNRWSGKRTFNKLWLPLLQAKLGESYKKTSAVFIWATIQRLYGARRSGLKKEMFGYVPGGYKKVIEAFSEKLLSEGVTVKTGWIANEVKTSTTGKPVISFTNQSSEEFDEVIITLPSGIAARICKQLSANEKQRLENIEYLGVICVAVLLNKPISPFYITNITDSRYPFTGVIEMSALVDKKHFNNQSLIYLPKYIPFNDPLFEQSDESVRKYFIDNLKMMYPHITDDNIQFAGVARAKHVITVAKINYSDDLPEIRTSVPGVSIINTAHIKDGTLNVNETVRVAETKLKEILK